MFKIVNKKEISNTTSRGVRILLGVLGLSAMITLAWLADKFPLH